MDELERSNAALARRWFQEVWNERRDETIDELWPVEGRGYFEGRGAVGREEFKDIRRTLLQAVPDLAVHLLDVVAEGHRVAVHWRITGTHLGHGLGLAPSGKSVDRLGMTRLVFHEGRLTECWDCWNFGGMVQRLSTVTPAEIEEHHNLTPRQAEVAHLMAARRTHKEIARVLRISPNTARRHCQAVLHRLGLHRREDVAAAIHRRVRGPDVATH